MDSRVEKHLNEINLVYKKQFGFQEAHSTEHVVMQLVEQINSSFEKILFT